MARPAANVCADRGAAQSGRLSSAQGTPDVQRRHGAAVALPPGPYRSPCPDLGGEFPDRQRVVDLGLESPPANPQADLAPLGVSGLGPRPPTPRQAGCVDRLGGRRGIGSFAPPAPLSANLAAPTARTRIDSTQAAARTVI